MSAFGRLFRVTTFGESHCAGVGCIVDGVPPRMQLTEEDIQVFVSKFHLSWPRSSGLDARSAHFLFPVIQASTPEGSQKKDFFT